MKNKWKLSFFILLTLFLLTSLLMTYKIIDQSLSISYLREGYQDTEYDLEEISRIIQGKLTYGDFKEISDKGDSALIDSTKVELNRLKIIFGEDGKVKKVMSQW